MSEQSAEELCDEAYELHYKQNGFEQVVCSQDLIRAEQATASGVLFASRYPFEVMAPEDSDLRHSKSASSRNPAIQPSRIHR